MYHTYGRVEYDLVRRKHNRPSEVLDTTTMSVASLKELPCFFFQIPDPEKKLEYNESKRKMADTLNWAVPKDDASQIKGRHEGRRARVAKWTITA